MSLRRKTIGDSKYAVHEAVSWVSWLLVLAVFTQRLAVPGLQVSLLVPIVFLWAAAALWKGVIEFDPVRSVLWCGATSLSGTVLLLQTTFVVGASIGIASWMLLFVMWLPFTLRIRDRAVEVFFMFAENAVRLGSLLASLCVAFILLQILGAPYVDVLAGVLPAPLLLQDYFTTYPFTFGSNILKANGWIGLEPSIVSFQLGVFLLLAVLLGKGAHVVILLSTGLICTAAGSGLLVLGVGLTAMMVWPRRKLLWRYAVLLVVVGVATLFTPVGAYLIGRASEFTNSRSSTSLRAVQSYVELWPTWTANVSGVIFGRGAGGAEGLLDGSGVAGILVATPVRMYFDYGLVAGSMIALLVLWCYLDGPSAVISAAIGVSLWTIQPGLTVPVLVFSLYLFVTLWSPRDGRRLELREGVLVPLG